LRNQEVMPKHSKKRRVYFFVGIACVIFVIAQIYRIVVPIYLISFECGVPCSSDAKLLQYYKYTEWQHGEHWAKISIDQSDVNELIKQVRLNRPPVDAGDFEVSYKDRLQIRNIVSNKLVYNNGDMNTKTVPPHWWKPDAIHRFIAVKSEESQDDLRLLISLDDPHRAIIYVFHRRD